MIGVLALLLILIGIPTVVYLSDRRRNRRTAAELEDDAVRVAKGASDGPGSNEPVTLEPPWSDHLVLSPYAFRAHALGAGRCDHVSLSGIIRRIRRRFTPPGNRAPIEKSEAREFHRGFQRDYR